MKYSFVIFDSEFSGMCPCSCCLLFSGFFQVRHSWGFFALNCFLPVSRDLHHVFSDSCYGLSALLSHIFIQLIYSGQAGIKLAFHSWSFLTLSNTVQMCVAHWRLLIGQSRLYIQNGPIRYWFSCSLCRTMKAYAFWITHSDTLSPSWDLY